MNKMTFVLFFSWFFLFSSLVNPVDYVPNEETAIKIAEAVWLPIYGNEIYKKKPFKAILLGDTVWHVSGSLPSSKVIIYENGDTTYNFSFGGVPHAYIRKSNGLIYNVYHTK